MSRHAVSTEFDRILALVSALPAVSDHEHHHEDVFFREPITLERLIANAYITWSGALEGDSSEARAAFLDRVKYNTYWHWFERGLRAVHGLAEPLTLENWDAVSRRVGAAYAADRDFHWRALRAAGYRRLIQDTFWDPGSDVGHPEIFTPAFRCDKFMYGYHRAAVAPNDYRVWERLDFTGNTLDDFAALMREKYRSARSAGKLAAIKCAEAYFRTIDFQPDDRAAAEQAFGTPPDRITREQHLAFGNYIFNRACEIAAELEVPLQVHTGLARLADSQPMKLEATIARHPKTRFVLFHSGFPWTHEVSGLAHNYSNVCPSLTWTATICTSAAIRALHDYLDVARSANTITWGSDCWIAEDSVGALLAWRFIVAKVIAERLADHRLAAADTEDLAERLLSRNVIRVYGLGGIGGISG